MKHELARWFVIDLTF